MIKLPYKLLIYDIETAPLKAWIWRLGDQVVRHDQLDDIYREITILTIAAKWFGEPKEKTIVLTGPKLISDFDKLARSADVCIGKNSDAFDVKHINTQRLLQGLKPYPEWLDTNDDLEKQLRKYFSFSSHSLDSISKTLGMGGKVKMERQDWTDIVNYLKIKEFTNNKLYTSDQINDISIRMFNKSYNKVLNSGVKALEKMKFYNKKDVLDTESILNRVLPYITLKRNSSVQNKDGQGCVTCGSMDIKPTKIIIKGKTKFQQFECLEHKGYAGKASWYYKKNSHNKTFNPMGN